MRNCSDGDICVKSTRRRETFNSDGHDTGRCLDIVPYAATVGLLFLVIAQVPTQFTQFEVTPTCGPPPLTVKIFGRLVTGNGSVIPGEVGSVQVFINNQRGPSLASVNSTVNGVVVLASKGEYDFYAIFNGRGVWQSARTETVRVRVADDCLPVPMYVIVTVGMLVVVAVGIVYLAKTRKDSLGF